MGNCVIASIDDLVDSINNTIESVLSMSSIKITQEDIRYYCDISKTDRYKTLLIPKKHKKGFRTVFAPQGKLPIILKAINEILNNLYVPEKYVSGFIRRRSIVDNAYLHIGQEFVLNVDIKDFFDSIKYERIAEKLTEKPYCFTSSTARIISLLTCIVSPKDNSLCLAQGSPVSPTISNIIFEDIDRYIYNYCCTKYVKYSRYADDLTFSCNRDILYKGGDLFRGISNILSSNYFFLNKKKSRLQNRSQRQEVTGIVVNIKPNVTREYIKEIRDLLFIWKHYGIEDAYKTFYRHHKLRLRIQKKDTPYFVNYLRGKINYLGLVRGRSDISYIKFVQQFNSLLQDCNNVFVPIRYVNFNTKIIESGINLSSYSTRIDQFGNKRTYITSGKFGKVYFDSDLFQKLIENDWDLAYEFFSEAMKTNRILSQNGGYLYAQETYNPELLSLNIKKAKETYKKKAEDIGWYVDKVQKLSLEEIEKISSIVVIPSKYGSSAKINYKNGSIKFIPLDRFCPAGPGEELIPENIEIVILKNNYYYSKTIKRIRYKY